MPASLVAKVLLVANVLLVILQVPLVLIWLELPVQGLVAVTVQMSEWRWGGLNWISTEIKMIFDDGVYNSNPGIAALTAIE